MKKQFLVFMIMLSSIPVFSQTHSFDIFMYQSPDFFTRNELTTMVQFNLTNNDTSFCSITLYKSRPAKADAKEDVVSGWNKLVKKRFSKADKIPGRIYTQQTWDGWASTLAIGNFYQNKKKCVVMLNSFRKNETIACAVFAFSDKSFKGTVELFSKNLHLINQ